MAEQPSSRVDPDVVAYSAFAGLRNDVDPERFGLTDLTVGTNIDLDKSGRISRRAGYALMRAGATHSLWAQGGLGVFVSGSTLYRLSDAYGAVVLRTGLTVGARMSYLPLNDSLFFSNGYERGELRFGTLHSWGLDVPAPPAAVVTVGSMTAGIYQFSMTYLRNDGQESGAPLAGVVTVPEGGGLVFTLPVSTDLEVADKVVYLTPPNGERLYRALLLPNAQTTATYQNDARELAQPLDTQFLGPPPAGHLLCYYRGCVFVAVEDVIYRSEPFAYSLFDLRKYMQMDGVVTMMEGYEDNERSPETNAVRSGIFIGTEKQCGTLIGSNADDFQYVQKTDYGAVRGAVAHVEGSVFGDGSTNAGLLPMFVTTNGICIGMPDMTIKNLTRSKYGFSAAGQGAAFFNAGPNRFVAVTNY